MIRKLIDQRLTVGRLANQEAWNACATLWTDGLVVPNTMCNETAADPTTDAALEARWGPRLSARRTPVTLRAEALLELKWHHDTLPALDRALAALEQARELVPQDPIILNDLAVAYIEMAERSQQLEPMLRALDLVERALVQDSMLVAARFNRALIMERLYLLESARRAWTRYLVLDAHSKWREEAEQHIRELPLTADTTTWNLAKLEAAPADSTRSWVSRSPQTARDFCFFTLLPAWGRAVQGGKGAHAKTLLRLAQDIARGFAEMQGDQSVALAIEPIMRAQQPRDRMARAYIELGEGLGLFVRAAFDQSPRLLESARNQLRALNSPAERWAAVYWGVSLVNRGNYQKAESIFSEILARATASEPALVGRTVWAQGLSQVRQGNFENANRRYRDAAPHIERARERENGGALSYLLSEGLLLAGQSVAGRTEAYRGLRVLSPFRKSNFLNNHLSTVAAQARTLALSHAALALMDEVLVVAQNLGRPDVLAWALRARARDLMAVGRTTEARNDLTSAQQWVDKVPEGNRDRVRADVSIVLGQLELDNAPHAALAILTDVVNTYRTLNTGVLLPNALYTTARAARASGHAAEARGHLDQAIQHIEKQRATFQSAESRAMLYETVETVFDEVIGLELDARPTSAFDYLERSRAAARSLGETGAHSDGSLMARVRNAVAQNMLLIEYALLPGEIAVWTVSARRDSLYRIPVPRDSIAALVEQFGRETNLTDAHAKQARASLFEVLIRPLERELKGISKLAIVPDRELHSIPFAALWDSLSGKYVIEQYQVHTLPSAAFLVDAAQPRARPGAVQALVVGNPAIDTAAGLQLPPLPGAKVEADSIAQLYDRSLLLVEERATRDSVLRLLPDQSVFHFAGHAVFNSEQPELSYLALAARGAHETGILDAREIGTLRLSNLKLVVLAACSTLNPRTTRVGVVAGLAHSFLRAGAPAIVSSLWSVGDAGTAGLLYDFHKYFAKSGDAAGALQSAQLDALKSEQPERRAIQNWAAFIYTGI